MLPPDTDDLDGDGVSEIFAEENSEDGRFVFGSAPTLADCFLVPQMYNARRFGCDLVFKKCDYQLFI